MSRKMQQSAKLVAYYLQSLKNDSEREEFSGHANSDDNMVWKCDQSERR